MGIAYEFWDLLSDSVSYFDGHPQAVNSVERSEAPASHRRCASSATVTDGRQKHARIKLAKAQFGVAAG